jgi:leader peptidase (prepilin peptidase)/N-methyltransferase
LSFLFVPALVFILGLVMGSFATVLCHRIPREIPLGLFSHQRSRCPACEKIIPWYRNVPVFAWLWLRGKCGDCGAPIPARYPLIELATGVLFLTTYLVHAHAPAPIVDEFAYWAELVKLLYFTLSLIVIVVIDLEFRIIPDRFSLGNWVIAIVAAVAWGQPSWQDSLMGGAFGFGSFWLMATVYEKMKGIEGLGFGDVKMMGWLGSWLGLLGVPFVILSASVTGLGVGILAMRRSGDGFQTAIPFGPFLAAGAYAAWILQTFGVL